MSYTITYNYDAGSDYTYDSSQISVVTGSYATLLQAGGSYYETNPTISPNETFLTDSITAFSASETVSGTGSDLVKYAINANGVQYYHNGSAWAVGSTYEETNTATEINNNISTLDLHDGYTIYPVAYLHSAAGGSYAPQLDSLTLTYSYFASSDTLPNTCIVTGYVLDPSGVGLGSATVSAIPVNPKIINNKNFIVGNQTVSDMTDENGYFELTLIRTTEYSPEVTYDFTIKPKAGNFLVYRNISVPDVETIDFDNLL